MRAANQEVSGGGKLLKNMNFNPAAAASSALLDKEQAAFFATATSCGFSDTMGLCADGTVCPDRLTTPGNCKNKVDNIPLNATASLIKLNSSRW